MAVLETPSSRKRRMSSSLPLSRETPSEPFGRPSFRPEALALARHSRVRSEIRSRSTSANKREEGGHDFGLDVALALDAWMFSFIATKATPALAIAPRMATI